MDNFEIDSEEPLSPVLNFKYTLKHSKKSKRKSRVRLSDRFAEQDNVEDSASRANSDTELVLNHERKSESAIFKAPLSPDTDGNADADEEDPVGLKTASGKKIKLSKDIIRKQWSLFDDILHPLTSHRKRSNKFNFIHKTSKAEFKSYTDVQCKEMQEKSEYYFTVLSLMDNEVGNKRGNKSTHPSPDFHGFSPVSPAILEKYRYLDGYIKSLCGEPVLVKRKLNLSPELPPRKKAKKEQLKDTPVNENDTNYADELFKKRDSKENIGFQTASGRNITISEKVLKKAQGKSIFTKIPDEELSDVNFTEYFSNDTTVVSKDGNLLGEKISNEKSNKLSALDQLIPLKENSFQNTRHETTASKTLRTSLDAAGKMCNSSSELETGGGSNTKAVEVKSLGFQTAAGRQIIPNHAAMRRSMAIIKSIEGNDADAFVPITGKTPISPKSTAKKQFVGRVADSNNTKTLIKCHENTNQMCNSENNDKKKNTSFGEFKIPWENNLKGLNSQEGLKRKVTSSGFQSAGGKKIIISNEALKRSREMIEGIEDRQFSRSGPNCLKESTETRLATPGQVQNFFGFKSAAGKPIAVSCDVLRKSKAMFDEVGDGSLPKSSVKEPVESRCEFPAKGKTFVGCQLTAGTQPKSPNTILTRSKAMLDVTEDDLIPKRIANDLKKEPESGKKVPTQAEKIIEDFYLSDDSLNTTTVMDGVENISSIISTSVERKKRLGISLPPSCKGTIRFQKETLEKVKDSFKDIIYPSTSTNITPIKGNSAVFYSTPVKATPARKNMFMDATLTPIKEENEESIGNGAIKIPRKGNVEDWISELEQQRTILENQLLTIIEKQNALKMQVALLNNNRLEKGVTGVLFKVKCNRNNRIKLNDLVRSGQRLALNPEDLVQFHFRVPKVLNTKDGALVVPNMEGLVGLSEIEVALKSMLTVDSKLIPPGWIANHYKWIVWKLKRYTTHFPQLQDCLDVENVLEQLKYRYDREIELAERPTLRRIMEKDECSQRRLILFVSAVSKNGIKLSDGWYEVPALLDEPLRMISTKNMLPLGTKIITTGAELINCEGCHPLKAPDSVKLKINYNSTRRAKWWTKLGVQKIPEPFPVLLKSIVENGGPVNCVKVCVARIYPIRFMERMTNGRIVWRNKRAEDRRQFEWENECLSENDFERNRRNVTSVLKLLLIESCAKNEIKTTELSVWSPTDSDLELLKEGFLYKIYNILPRSVRKNLTLSSTKKTFFKNLGRCLEFSRYERCFCPISNINIVNEFSFNEFDTVGLIVEISIDTMDQHVWLTDSSGKRLLFVKIFEGVNTCALLNNLSKGQIVALSNLRIKKIGNDDDFGQAMANQFSAVSPYPQQKHLKEALNSFIEELGENGSNIVTESEEKISLLLFKSDFQQSASSSLIFQDSDADVDHAPSY